jgi:hypothetical protein
LSSRSGILSARPVGIFSVAHHAIGRSSYYARNLLLEAGTILRSA